MIESDLVSVRYSCVDGDRIDLSEPDNVNSLCLYKKKTNICVHLSIDVGLLKVI